MTDPAISAAQRAIEAMPASAEPMEQPVFKALLSDVGAAAAREIAKSVQELHKPETRYAFPDNIPWACCSECGGEWPCETAKRVYPTEELER
ncbi:Uncharacterised protein [Mycobacteroides abscessus subsp. bolletii]|nr:Uncharacterised protein [Mycobacteroides abscessus subsp. bolletii]SKP58371.1 Uncharacterised protein [Mycobacteroides abscessus subsp. bolletii]SKP80624.1 Uncharacterised protein [Mycobacteroides abscessus subsp. bolletii]SKQ36449.1 Uncharacterised protein [Mycobacteroides abscessus subsp. bolletii]